jgi:predicted transcriptional regulator of viral defense system
MGNQAILSTISISRLLLAHDQYYFTPALLATLLQLERRQAYRLAARLKQAGLAAEVEKGKYLLLGLEPERVLSNPLFIANQLVNPCYVSYWSALHAHGLTTQVPQVVFCTTTRKKQPITFQGQTYRYVLIKPHKFFGYRRQSVWALPVLIADEAKAIVDSLDQPRYAGGLRVVAQALGAALPDLDLELLVAYSVRMEDKSLASRLGHLLEALGRSGEGLPVSQGPVALDPGRPRTGSYDTRWHIVVNASWADLMPAGVGRC